MIRHTGNKLSSLWDQALRSAGTLGQASGAAKALSGPPGLPARSQRLISTVIHATEYKEEHGLARIRKPGHVQFRPSANDLKNNPRLAPALGHAPVGDPAQLERFVVQGRLSNGLDFLVIAARNPARNAGEDVPTDLSTASHVIDHGDMTPEQSRRYEAAQGRPVFTHYETSGLEQANCVAGHLALTKQVLGQKVGASLSRHAMTQELAERMAAVRTVPGAAGKPQPCTPGSIGRRPAARLGGRLVEA